MALSDKFYSQFVAWMKIILPLAALGLLSTLFLISRTIDPTASLPVAKIDLEQRAQELGATNPSFAGVTDGGDQVTFDAQRAVPDRDDPEHLTASKVTARLQLTSGAVIDITSNSADMRQDKYTASLAGDVEITTTTGYVVTTDALRTRIDTLFAETPGAVEGAGPPGKLSAGRMRLTSDPETGRAELLFTDGVKLVYKLREAKE